MASRSVLVLNTLKGSKNKLLSLNKLNYLNNGVIVANKLLSTQVLNGSEPSLNQINNLVKIQRASIHFTPVFRGKIRKKFSVQVKKLLIVYI
jgi:hypothetical protein